MEMSRSFHATVSDPSGVGEARRRTVALASSLGYDEADVGRAGLLVTEAASNLVKHAGGGEILVRSCPVGATTALEVLILDRGPGMADLGAAFRDGYSSAGTPGTGLGAIRRAASELDVYSKRASGTALVAVLRPQGMGRDTLLRPFRVAGMSVAMPGEEVCGDDWAVRDADRGRRLILVMDGLGHGQGAADAAREARRLFLEGTEVDPVEILERLHRGLRPTRGAAGAVAAVDPLAGKVVYAGVGNIAGVILDPSRRRSMVSHNGILGHEARRIQAFTYELPTGATIILHSDGLTSHWDLASYPGVTLRHPALIAGLLYRDFRRERDDVTVVVARAWSP
jgi:anti-sigma regulatory factor (Ser/Thr protein kinase)